MDLKLFDPKSVFLSNLIGQKGMLSFSTFNFKAASLNLSPFFIRSYKGASHEAACLSTSSPDGVSLVGKEQYGVETHTYRYDGSSTNFGSSILFREKRVLDAFDDEYGGVVVNPEKLPSDTDVFVSILRSSLSLWRTEGKKGIWLKLPVEKCDLVPIAIREGFQYHHAERGYVMMTYWIPDEPCMLPANASHQVGVGGFVMNDKNEVLVVQEKHCAPELAGLWKLPTGFILEVCIVTLNLTLAFYITHIYIFLKEIVFPFDVKQSEEIFSGAVREVKEETGIDTEFLEVIAFRHAHNVAFEKSDLFFICMLRPVSSDIKIDDLEVQAAKWMALREFVEQPLIKGDNMFKKIIDMCIARMGKRYCGLSVHKVVSKFDNRLSSLYYNVVDDQRLGCSSHDSCTST
ncbi:nudix hydrolase 8 isoform X1 [Helianthus annuus]|uniref:nudix hydrolase 8 isoform X1 n=1 Tax=Helianthus annuus TaxID=4232 RepID=UPI000B8FAF35|nr:nudix hydrolase 8 isoform X1 [Helianthus annuus]